ncbi:MAG: restriction endonuclease subunit S [Coriobacteriaceae bacterium]|nr:MAG: restriction endonuclease subunit S [Coriobacteriaceae bacterium]
MAEKQNTPEIRFEGFTDPWEQRKLGEFGSVAMCKRIYKEQTSEQGDVPFFKIGTFGTDPDAFISNELFDYFKRTYPYPTPGTLLISAAGSIGRVVEYQGEKAYFQDSNIVWLEHDHRLNDTFLKPLYSQIEWGLEGSTIKRLYNKDLLSAEVTIPGSGEQKEIGRFFAKLDNLITLHQRKYDKLCTVKKSMLDKMFPKPGETEPEVRFKGFTDPWEQRKLGNCGTTYGGLTGKTKEDFGHGNARFIPYTNVFDNPLTDTKRLEAVEIDSSQNQVVYGDVFFTVSSETPDEVGMSSVWLSDQEDVYLNSFCFGYRQDSTFDPHYLAYMLRSSLVRSNLTLLAQGISRFNISKNKVMELSVPVPSVVEQKQLGQYFTKLDSLITLHQRKLDLLKNTKKSLLDKMFV